MGDATQEISRIHGLGYHLVPYRPKADTTSPRPYIPDHLTKAPSDAEIQTYLRLWPDADWAIRPVDTCVLDLEAKHGLDGMRDILNLCEHHGQSWGRTIEGCAVTRTKSGGWHIWFRQPDGEPLVGGHHIRPGVECKARNGTVHIPPSTGYTAIQGLVAPGRLPVLPDFLCREWRGVKKERKTGLPSYARRTFPDGQRRFMLCSVAGKLRSELAMGEDELYACLLAVRDARCEDPHTFSDHEVRTIACDFARKPVEDIDARAYDGDGFSAAILRLVGSG